MNDYPIKVGSLLFTMVDPVHFVLDLHLLAACL